MIIKNDCKKLKNWVKKHCIFISIITVVVLMCIFIIPILSSDLILWTENTTKISKIIDILQIISAFFVIFGTLVAVLQYYLSSHSKIVQNQTERVQKSIDLAQYYKENILLQFSVVRDVYNKCHVIEKLSSKTIYFSEFDYEEMMQLFSESEIKEIKSIQESQEFVDAIIQVAEAFSLNIAGYKFDNGKVLFNRAKLMTDFSSKYIMDLMNSMELFAMYFTHNVADESVVYESLYPTYLEMCRILYIDIAQCSEPGKAQLYRNITMLYNCWTEKEKQDNQKRKDSKKQNRNHGTIAANL